MPDDIPLTPPPNQQRGRPGTRMPTLATIRVPKAKGVCFSAEPVVASASPSSPVRQRSRGIDHYKLDDVEVEDSAVVSASASPVSGSVSTGAREMSGMVVYRPAALALEPSMTMTSTSREHRDAGHARA